MSQPGPRNALWEPTDPREAARERAAIIRRRKEAARRSKIIAGRDEVVDELPGAPLLEDWPLSRKRATAWLGISHSQMLGLLRGRSEELVEAGCDLGNYEGRGAKFTRRGLLHLALILDPQRNGRAAMVQAALTGRKIEDIQTSKARSAAHASACARRLDHARELAVAVREQDPREIWANLDRLDRWQLQAAVVALAAMVPPDLPGTGWLSLLGRSVGGVLGPGKVPGRGLAALVPRRDTGTWDLLEGPPS